MLEKTKEIIRTYEELTSQLADPEVASDPKRYREIAKQRHELEAVATKGRAYVKLMD
ncbi:MAG: PCRF domain-containing protein, partial [Fidelibacterota bacterium]